ncbi:MAG TPA: hypothetical protein VEB40_10570 [Flavipsychrobacter sp.]|nr:hypothetical protein [Flavipsychrobacter sp.]
MLGNVYDDMGDSVNALKTYKAGLQKFPNSGGLHLETGNYYFVKQDYNSALKYYELGIAKEPTHPSNYFRAAQIFLTMTEEEVWGMIYGEIFMNLEPNTERTQAMSKWLHDTYKSEIKIVNDTFATVSFSKTATMLAGSKILPFNSEYEIGFLTNVPGIGTINLESMCSLRSSFVKNFFENNKFKDYPVAILDYNYKIMKAGHFDAYNHWLLSQGDKDAFKKWKDGHKTEFDKFAEWFKANRISLNSKNVFLRENFGG